MRKIILITVVTLTSLFFYPNILSAQDNNQIIIGNKDSLYSSILDEQRNIWVHVPENSDVKKYPVIYLLDGRAHFYPVIGIVKHLSFNKISPDMIVVAIPNTNRFRDLTISHLGDSANPSGGGEKFIQFLEKELIPYIENKYPTSPYRTLIGHSFGGLLVVNTLIHHPEIFDNYIAIDPSIGWDNQKVLKDAKLKLEQNDFEDKSLYIAIANNFRKEIDTALIQKDTNINTFSIRSNFQFCKMVDAKKESKLNFEWKYYPNENHGSVPLISEYHGLRFLFSWFEFKHWGDTFIDPNVSADQLYDLLYSHYKSASDKLGYSIRPYEGILKSIGYEFMQMELFDKAYKMFKLNMQFYPESANVYDSMGDYCISQSDNNKAIEYFSKAVEIGDLPESKRKLEELKTKN